MILMGLGRPPFTICTKYGCLVLFWRFWLAQSSPAAEILHADLIGPEDDYKNKESENGYSFLLRTTWIFWCVYWATEKSPAALLHRASQLKPPDSTNAKNSVVFGYFPGKKLGNLITAPSRIPSTSDSNSQIPNILKATPIACIKKIAYQKLLNFVQKKSIFPTVRRWFFQHHGTTNHTNPPKITWKN